MDISCWPRNKDLKNLSSLCVQCALNLGNLQANAEHVFQFLSRVLFCSTWGTAAIGSARISPSAGRHCAKDFHCRLRRLLLALLLLPSHEPVSACVFVCVCGVWKKGWLMCVIANKRFRLCGNVAASVVAVGSERRQSRQQRRRQQRRRGSASAKRTTTRIGGWNFQERRRHNTQTMILISLSFGTHK